MGVLDMTESIRKIVWFLLILGMLYLGFGIIFKSLNAYECAQCKINPNDSCFLLECQP